jgi:hypothetical protein
MRLDIIEEIPGRFLAALPELPYRAELENFLDHASECEPCAVALELSGEDVLVQGLCPEGEAAQASVHGWIQRTGDAALLN